LLFLLLMTQKETFAAYSATHTAHECCFQSIKWHSISLHSISLPTCVKPQKQ
jgi:hypothetical protein